MNHPLLPLLDILSNPDHPAFAQALSRLDTLDPTTLTPEEAATLLAHLQTTIAHLTESKTLTAQQLATLRQRGTALQSYTRLK